ncbi:hypothetical protein BU202_08145 [Streptococcus cuniculi]|uniref:Uncharacterized protein n=1 Tax=Streptococcus cuniculi TaxID=1432788 RepID=A0A1Q8E659_9STRE|nr:hypothetical protein [Streptococcus cuniculi]OLF47287.1 hypothetical protein BU202_08145 [Streptococcus cuniculi]
MAHRWELPLTSEEANSTGYIHGNAKSHLFNSETGMSYCKKYWQKPYYASEIKYTGKDRDFCKKCLKKYKRLEEVE